MVLMSRIIRSFDFGSAFLKHQEGNTHTPFHIKKAIQRLSLDTLVNLTLESGTSARYENIFLAIGFPIDDDNLTLERT